MRPLPIGLYTYSANKKDNYTVTPKARQRHTAIFGKSGVGKTTLMRNMPARRSNSSFQRSQVLNKSFHDEGEQAERCGLQRPPVIAHQKYAERIATLDKAYDFISEVCRRA